MDKAGAFLKMNFGGKKIKGRKSEK